MVAEAVNLSLKYRTEVAEFYATTGRLPERLDYGNDDWRDFGKYFSSVEWRDQEAVFSVEPDYRLSFRSGPSAAEDEGSVPALSFRFAVADVGDHHVMLCGRAPAPAGFSSRESQHTTVRLESLPFFCRP
jgi:hypothetical protein